MKTAATLFSFLALASFAQAQLLLDTRSFYKEGATDVAVQGTIEFWKDSATSKTGTVKLFIENISVFRDLSNHLTGHENGTLTGFGFNVGTGFSYVNNSFTETLLGPIAGLKTGSEPYGIDFSRSSSFSVGGGPSGETFQAGAFAVNPAPREGLSGGFAALFTFQFSASTSNKVSEKFNADYFFCDTDKKDMYFRFQSISEHGCDDELSDKVFVGFPDDLPPTPEPSTYGLMGAGLLFGAVMWRRRKQKASS